jgi:hypothetical protein
LSFVKRYTEATCYAFHLERKLNFLFILFNE